MIVLIDEYLQNQLLLARVLARYPAPLEIFDTVESALAAVFRSKPDLIIVNITARLQNSALEIVKHLRAQGIGCPIVALVAYPMSPEQLEVFNQEYDEFLVKPYSPQELHRVLERQLSTRAAVRG